MDRTLLVVDDEANILTVLTRAFRCNGRCRFRAVFATLQGTLRASGPPGHGLKARRGSGGRGAARIRPLVDQGPVT